MQQSARKLTGNREGLQQDSSFYPPSILIDGNLLVDHYFNRPSMWIGAVNEIITLITNEEVKGYVTESDVEKIWHLKDKMSGEEAADSTIDQISKIFTICKVDEKTVQYAMRNHFYNDFDCSLKSTIFKENNLSAIITSKPFNSPLDTQDPSLYAQTPEQFINHVANQDFPTIKNEKSESGLRYLQIGDWCISGFKVESSINEISKGIVYYHNIKSRELYSESVSGKGAIEVLCQAVDRIISSEMALDLNGYSLHSIKLKNRGEGVSSESYVTTSLIYNSTLFTGEASSKNSVEAAFYAYIEAASKIYEYRQYSPVAKVFIKSKRYLSVSTLLILCFLPAYVVFAILSSISVGARMGLNSSIRHYEKRIIRNHRKLTLMNRKFTLTITQGVKSIINFIFTAAKRIDKIAIKTVEPIEDVFPQYHSSKKLSRWLESAECWKEPFQ